MSPFSNIHCMFTYLSFSFSSSPSSSSSSSTLSQGQCDFQPPYSTVAKLDSHYMFNLKNDYHELHDQKKAQPERCVETV